MQLSNIERDFIEHVERGESFDATTFYTQADANLPHAEPVVRASVIRQLLLKGIAIEPLDEKGVSIVYMPTQFGIRLKGALIEGRILLDGLSGSGQQGLAPMHLTGCTLSGGLSARNSCVAELFLTDCIVADPLDDLSDEPPINLDDCRINGPLDLSGMHGAGDTVPCWVSAKGVHIVGDVMLTNTRLFYQARDDLGLNDSPRYGLNLLGAVIEKSFSARCGFVCVGGLTMTSARVDGDIWMLGSHLSGGEGPAFNGQSLQLGGSVVFRPAESRTDDIIVESVVDGEIKLMQASIGGSLLLFGTVIGDHPRQSRPGIADISVNLRQCRIGSRLAASAWVGELELFRAFRTSSYIDMELAVIGNEARFSGVEIGASLNDDRNPVSLSARRIELGGDFVIQSLNHAGMVHRSEMTGSCSLNGARIRRDLNVDRLMLAESRSSVLLVQNARIAGALNIVDLKLTEGIDLAKTEVEGNLVVALHRSSHDPFVRPSAVKVNLFQVSAAYNCWVHADVSNLSLGSCRIGGSARLDVVATGNVSLERANIHGDLILEQFRFRRPPDALTDKHNHVLTLKGASIDGNLKIEIPLAEYLDDIVITGAWRSGLGCYPAFQYLEVEVSRSDGVWYGAFLMPQEPAGEYKGLYLCGGRSNMFHELNESGQLDLESEEKAKEYLRLFCASVWGDNGAFVIAESSAGLPFAYVDGDAFPPGLTFSPDAIRPIELLPASTPVLDSDGDERKPPKGERYLFKAYVRYGNGLFEAYFSIRNGGQVVMLADSPLVNFDAETVPEFKAPLRKANEFFTRKSYFVTERESGMKLMPADDIDELKLQAERLIKQEMSAHNFAHATIDLRDARVIGLDDDDGAGWGEDVRLRLLNFRYQRFSSETPVDPQKTGLGEKLLCWVKLKSAATVRSFGLILADLNLHQISRRILQSRYALKPPPRRDKALRNRIRQRIKWLELQYPNYPDNALRTRLSAGLGSLAFLVGGVPKRQSRPELFEPQPYAQAAAVFRVEGAAELARNIDLVQRRMAGRKDAMDAGLRRPLIELLYGLYGMLSRYGLSPVRTFIWMLVFVAVGGLMTDAANRKGLLIVDATPVVQSVQEGEGRPGELGYASDPPGRRAGELLCGDAVEPVLYAADIFIPLLDLEQASRCMIRPAGSPIPAPAAGGAPGDTKGWLARLRTIAHDLVPDNVVLWHWMQSLYAIMGWVMVSLFVFTLTHKLRSQDALTTSDDK